MNGHFGYGGSTGSPTPAGAVAALTVATVAALSLLSVTGMPDGGAVNVASLRDVFVLETSASTPDGVTIATSPTAGRVWRRCGLSSPAWVDPVAAVAYAIDGSTGNNLSIGDAGHPLAAWAELDRRIHGQTIAYPLTVSVANYDDALLAHLTLDPVNGGGVAVQGTPDASPVHSGAVNVYTAAVPGSNLPYRLTDSGVADWTAYRGKRLRLTSGTYAGAVAWVLKNAAGTAWTSAWCMPGNYTLATPAHGDTYVIETLPTINTAIEVTGNVLAGNGSVTFSNVLVQGVVVRSGGLIEFFGCDLTGMLLAEGTSVTAYGCLGLPTLSPSSAIALTRSGVYAMNQPNGSNPPSTFAVLDDVVAVANAGGIIANGGAVHVATGVGLGVFDSSTGGGLTSNGDGVYVTKRGVLHTTGPLYGSGNAGVGVRADGNCIPEYLTGQKPTITGTGGNVVLAGGAPIAWGAVPAAISTTTGAGYVAA